VARVYYLGTEYADTRADLETTADNLELPGVVV
jgi:hypothetical protein